jgi:transcriptional regulator with XRE-family HTH domain
MLDRPGPSVVAFRIPDPPVGFSIPYPFARACWALDVLGWSKAELAGRLHTDEGSVRQYLRGKREIPAVLAMWLEALVATYIADQTQLEAVAQTWGIDPDRVIIQLPYPPEQALRAIWHIGWNEKQLAVRWFSSPHEYYAWKRGDYQMPTERARWLELLAAILERHPVPPGWRSGPDGPSVTSKLA